MVGSSFLVISLHQERQAVGWYCKYAREAPQVEVEKLRKLNLNILVASFVLIMPHTLLLPEDR